VRNTWTDDFKTRVYLAVTDELAQLGLQFTLVVCWLVEHIERVGGHVEHPSSALRIGSDDLEVYRRIRLCGQLCVENTFRHDRRLIMRPQIQTAGIDEEQYPGAASNHCELFET
jgi:hypothetical protein